MKRYYHLGTNERGEPTVVLRIVLEGRTYQPSIHWEVDPGDSSQWYNATFLLEEDSWILFGYLTDLFHHLTLQSGKNIQPDELCLILDELDLTSESAS